jgi:hypothetical protein
LTGTPIIKERSVSVKRVLFMSVSFVSY